MVAKLSNEQIFNLTEALNQLTQSSYIFPVKVSFIILKNLGSLAPVYNSILEKRDETRICTMQNNKNTILL